jgi:proline dehydrogenase
MSLLERTIAHGLPLLPRAVVRRFSAPYIAGETSDDALRVVADLNRQRILATVDLLGEDIRRTEEADQTRRIYEEILDACHRRNLDCNVSVKLTALGLKLDEGLCLDQMIALLEHAKKMGNFVRIDMEDSTCTDATLEMYRVLRERFDNVGVVIQACLRRSVEDVDRLAEMEANVRVCKGIYVEKRSIAYQDRTIVQRNFADLVHRLLRAGCYVGIATHDELLAWEGMRLVQELGLDPSRYEFQMLLGVDRVLRDLLVDAGHRLRVYVPFGENWYQYSLRRLKENPRLAGYAFKALFRPTES